MRRGDEDDFEGRLRRSEQRRKIAIFVVLGIAAVAPFAYIFWDHHKVTAANDAFEAEARAQTAREQAFANRPLTATETAELDDLAHHVVDDAKALRAAWQAATTPEALADLVPGTSGCGLRMSAPTAQAADSFVQYGSIDANYFGNVSFETFHAGTLPTTDFDDRVTKAIAIASRVAAGSHARADFDASLALVAGEPIVFLVETERREPLMLGNGYEPGEVRGMAYVFDPRQRAVTCAGAVHVVNRPEINVEYYTTSVLDDQARDRAARAILGRDLQVQLDIAIATSLHGLQ
jgi:hypothetical protein